MHSLHLGMSEKKNGVVSAHEDFFIALNYQAGMIAKMDGDGLYRRVAISGSNKGNWDCELIRDLLSCRTHHKS